MGPLINESAVQSVNAAVDGAVSLGAKVITGGQENTLGGNFYDPAVLLNVTADMKITQNEIFGPVVPMMSFTDEADAIKLANDTPHDLASYFFTQDLHRAWRVSEGHEYGMVGVNDVAISTPEAPFGGFKEPSCLLRQRHQYSRCFQNDP